MAHRQVSSTMLDAGDTKMKEIFLPVHLTLPLEAIRDIVLRRKGKSGKVTWDPAGPPASCSHLGEKKTLKARWAPGW